MLQRINVVEEIGRFSKLTHNAEAFVRLSLIFARNGYGKSTLCAILRSASDGNAGHISARRKLGAVGDSRVQSTWASGATVSFASGKWNSCPGKIHVFDQEYVAKNLHVGDSVTRDNKRSLLPVVLGDEGVRLADEVNRLDAEQRTVDERRKQANRTITTRCKGMLDSEVDAFCKAEVPADLEEKTKIAAQRVTLIKQAEIVRQKKNPPSLPLGSLAKAEELLGRTIDGLNQDAVQRVHKHLAEHDLGERAHAWLQYGTTHAPAVQCPYCAQDTHGLPLISAYQAFFSDELKSLKTEVDELSADLDKLTTEKLSELVGANDAEFNYWRGLCDLPAVPALSDTEQAVVDAGLASLRTHVANKRGDPLAPSQLTTDAEAIRQALALLIAYNEGVAACAATIDQARAETADGDLAQAEKIHAKWIALAERASDPVKSAVTDYLAADARLSQIKTDKTAAQSALTTYTNTTMTARQGAVNEFLEDFGASFRIVDTKTNFVGREPNTEFAIEIGTHKVKAGDKSDSEPSFKTVLSAGDKTTLALAFFLAQVRADPGLQSAVIVFDDPFSSQDLDRQFQTTSHIRAISGDACQTIVLSHDPRFLHAIEKNADGALTRTFQLQCSDAGEGSVKPWSSEDELKSEYIRQSEVIREYASQGSLLKGQTLNSIHQSIRPFLEDYLRVRFPGRFPDQAHIFEMANAIQAAGASDPMAPHVADLLALNEYTRPNMHGGGATPVPTELRTHCRKVVKIVGSY